MSSRRAGIAALVCVALAGATIVQTFSWNQTSHYALVRSIAHGTPHIDRYASETGDKARFRGHWYSSRAPGLALFTLPAYGALTAIHAPALARHAKAERGADEMVWALTLWGAVLPGLVLLFLVRWMGERFEPGYGTAAALTLGLGTLVLPLSTLLFSHVFTACLGFGAFALLVREREGPASLLRLFVAGLLIGLAITAEYPLLFAGVVIGVYGLSRQWRRVERGLVYAAGAALGAVPLALYDKWAYGSFTHVAYADLPQHQSGFFGIRPPSLDTAVTLLFSSRGLLTLSPVLIMGAVGTVLLYRRGRRAEALAIAAIVLLYLGYNAGYYLPFGGGTPGPRFLTTMLPFLAVPLALAWRRFPAQTLALAGISVVVFVLATVTHPLIGYETETVTWTRYLASHLFQPSIVSLFNGTRGWEAPLPFLAPRRGRDRARRPRHAAAVAVARRPRHGGRACGRLGGGGDPRAHRPRDRPPGAREHLPLGRRQGAASALGTLAADAPGPRRARLVLRCWRWRRWRGEARACAPSGPSGRSPLASRSAHGLRQLAHAGADRRLRELAVAEQQRRRAGAASAR